MELTSLPPANGEDDRASASTSDARPSDAEQAAAERLDSAEAKGEADAAKVSPSLPDTVSSETGADVPAAEMPEVPPAVDGESGQASEPTIGVRLSDVERNAAGRVNGVETKHDEDVAAAPPPLGPASEAAEISVAEKPEVAQAFASEAPMPPPVVTGDSEAQPAEEGAQSSATGAQALTDGGALPVEAAEPAEPTVEDANPLPDEDAARLAAASAPTLVSEGLPTVDQAEATPKDAGNAPQAPATASPAAPALTGNVQPLSSALDAAVRLAADANAAAEALESLKRLLQRQLPDVAVGLATPAPTGNADPWADPTDETPKPPPLPMPLPGDQASNDLPDVEPRLPALLPPRHVPMERKRFDARGFFAGFALSWAFGVILYLFMTAG